jgi:hypothetical protein
VKPSTSESFHFLNSNSTHSFFLFCRTQLYYIAVLQSCVLLYWMIAAHVVGEYGVDDIQRMLVVVAVRVTLLSLMGVLVQSDRCSTNISSTDRTERGILLLQRRDHVSRTTPCPSTSTLRRLQAAG